MHKPRTLFDRDHEWTSLVDFVDTAKPGSSLGLVYGRRRQGKTFLLQTLAESTRGFYFAALRQSDAQNLQRLAAAYRDYTGSRARISFATWEEAFEALLALGEDSDKPVVAIVDEFPYLLDGAPELPSILQSLLSPRGKAATQWRTRLVLCGSALSTMRGLLAGTAPLRGRAALDLMIHPFGYRDAAVFWQVAHDPDMAMRLNALVGGTPAYFDMSGGLPPEASEHFDGWVASTLLNSASAMFREGNILLSEEDRISDTATYLAVLSAISQGATRRGEIASAVGRAADALTHPLTVLNEARFIRPQSDALKQRRTTYHIAEPILRLSELVIQPHEARLSRHQSTEVWAQAADTVSSNIYGPHFEEMSRLWCAEHASPKTLGGDVDVVAPTEVACREHHTNHEIDVVVVESRANRTTRVSAIGEAKWRTRPCDTGHLHRLEHLRELLRADDARLLLFSRAGFSEGLLSEASQRSDTELVDIHRIYNGN